MAPYHHQINTHRRTKNAHRIKRFALILIIFITLVGVVVLVDWIINNFNTKTVVSTESSSTVQSARINIFQTPYFSFQADDSWREVTDELNLKNQGNSNQYLYRSYNRNFIEHELWVAVNLPEDYPLERHNIPTRAYPVRIEADGSLTRVGTVSDSCATALSSTDQNLQPHIMTVGTITLFCDPNNNGYQVAVGVPEQTEKLIMPSGDGRKNVVTITYRNIKAIPDIRQLEAILQTFRSK